MRPQPPLPHSTLYSCRLLQSGAVTVYLTFWVWCAMQSAPERPGAVEVAFLLRGDDDEDDLVGLRCYASAHREGIQSTMLP